jgi:hypothetical protein
MSLNILELGCHVALDICKLWVEGQNKVRNSRNDRRSVDLLVKSTVDNKEWPAGSSLLQKTCFILRTTEDARGNCRRKVVCATNPACLNVERHLVVLSAKGFDKVNAGLNSNGRIVRVLKAV